MVEIEVTEADFDIAEFHAKLETLGGGGVASFTGVVRGGNGLISLRLDHYPAMTKTRIEQLVGEARMRWPLLGVIIHHRVGLMLPCERIVFVGTAATHRGAALESCAFLIDWLKTSAPFWKKESFADGSEHWVEARAEDDAVRDSWGAANRLS